MIDMGVNEEDAKKALMKHKGVVDIAVSSVLG